MVVSQLLLIDCFVYLGGLEIGYESLHLFADLARVED